MKNKYYLLENWEYYPLSVARKYCRELWGIEVEIECIGHDGNNENFRYSMYVFQKSWKTKNGIVTVGQLQMFCLGIVKGML